MVSALLVGECGLGIEELGRMANPEYLFFWRVPVMRILETLTGRDSSI